MKKIFKHQLIILGIFLLMDVLITLIGLSRIGVYEEGNPLIRSILINFGLYFGTFLIILTVFILGYFIIYKLTIKYDILRFGWTKFFFWLIFFIGTSLRGYVVFEWIIYLK